MKIFIAKKQYGALVDLLYLADWMLNAHHVDDSPDTSQYRDVIQVLLSHAKDMQAEDLVESFEGRLMPSRVVEDRMQPIIEEYDATSMWEDLIALLGLRDALRARGDEALSKMPGEERIQVLLDHEEPWGREFEEHGLSRLVVEAPPSHLG